MNLFQIFIFLSAFVSIFALKQHEFMMLAVHIALAVAIAYVSRDTKEERLDLLGKILFFTLMATVGTYLGVQDKIVKFTCSSKYVMPLWVPTVWFLVAYFIAIFTTKTHAYAT